MAKIKPSGNITITKSGGANIPARIRNEIDAKSLNYVLDAKSAIVFSPEASADEVLKSIEILRQTIELRKTTQ